MRSTTKVDIIPGMRNLFAGYFAPTPDEERTIWETGVIIPDACVLLSLYEYPTPIRGDFFKTLETLRDRLWVAHQAGREFLKNRVKAISQQITAYQQQQKELHQAQRRILALMPLEYRRHPVVRAASLAEFQKAVTTIDSDLKRGESELRQIQRHDPILKRVNDLLDGRIGGGFTSQQLEHAYRQGEIRYAQKLPPGYMDEGKPGVGKYGDLIIWMQILEMARIRKQPVIYVTGDRKEDWWWKIDDKAALPRPELADELRVEAGVPLLMYTADEFLEKAREIRNVPVLDATITAVKAVRESATPMEIHQIDWADSESIERYASEYVGRQRRELQLQIEEADCDIQALEAQRAAADVANPSDVEKGRIAHYHDLMPQLTANRWALAGRLESLENEDGQKPTRLHSLFRRIARSSHLASLSPEAINLITSTGDCLEWVHRARNSSHWQMPGRGEVAGTHAGRLLDHIESLRQMAPDLVTEIGF